MITESRYLCLKSLTQMLTGFPQTAETSLASDQFWRV